MNRGLRRRALLLVVAGMLAVSGCAGRWPGLSGSEARHADNASLEDLMAFAAGALHRLLELGTIGGEGERDGPRQARDRLAR